MKFILGNLNSGVKENDEIDYKLAVEKIHIMFNNKLVFIIFLSACNFLIFGGWFY
jgi:hypothetical protein